MTHGAANVTHSRADLTRYPEATFPLVQRNEGVSVLFWRALVGLLVFDVLGFGHSFARMHRFVSNWRVSKKGNSGKTVDDVCGAVNYACTWYPKRVLCLQRSAVTTCLLRSCGIRASMVMGVQILPFKAHAWTEVDGKVINERRPIGPIYRAIERC
jgi:hypothetical protein